MKRNCTVCKKVFNKPPSVIKKGHGIYCSIKCRCIIMAKKFTGDGNPFWSGGKHFIECLFCKNFFGVNKARLRSARFCSHSCRAKFNIGKLAPRFKNGRYVGSHGYIQILHRNHPFKSKRNTVKEHRLIIEKFLGRFLAPNEIVHHINGIKTDNQIENLMVFNSNSAHIRWHRSRHTVKLNEIIFDGSKHLIPRVS